MHRSFRTPDCIDVRLSIQKLRYIVDYRPVQCAFLLIYTPLSGNDTENPTTHTYSLGTENRPLNFV